MTNRVVVEGSDLTVSVDDTPKRRTAPVAASTKDGRSKSGRTLEEIVREPNPYWTDDGQSVVMQQTDPYD